MGVPVTPMDDSTFITRVRLKNYRSIAACDVKLGPLQFLVGPNGAGKSNFLDAMRFVSDSLNRTLVDAMNERGGISGMIRRATGPLDSCQFDFGFRTRDGGSGNYFLDLGRKLEDRAHGVRREELTYADAAGHSGFYKVESGRVISSNITNPPAASADRLYLVRVSGLAEFRPVYDAMSTMVFYNLDPHLIRNFEKSTSPNVLAQSGKNLPGVLLRLQSESPKIAIRIGEYLKVILPGLERLHAEQVGPAEYIQFWQGSLKNQAAAKFLQMDMSDGTLRALGVLTAIFQFADRFHMAGSLVGIEEPEAALHPAAAGVLRGALREASTHSQVIVTSHSPDLLDDPSIPESEILAVSAEEGATNIGPLDDAARSAVRDKLFTAGELLRMNQLQPEPQQSESMATETSA
jgi:predicted ATPase